MEEQKSLSYGSCNISKNKMCCKNTVNYKLEYFQEQYLKLIAVYELQYFQEQKFKNYSNITLQCFREPYV